MKIEQIMSKIFCKIGGMSGKFNTTKEWSEDQCR